MLRKIPHVISLAFIAFPVSALTGISPVLIYIWRTRYNSRDFLEWAAIIAAAVTGLFLAWLCKLLWLALRDLPRAGFGVCSGLTQTHHPSAALTDWLTDLFDRLAGTALNGSNASKDSLLTFGNLEAAGIELKMMTTNLSVRRPYTLPFSVHPDHPERDGRYSFKIDEWHGYFPQRVMTWLLEHTIEVPRNPGYRYLPDTGNFPVIVAVRMSLSFPLLLSAVPLYRQDWTYCDPTERDQLRRCIFSDGGISSNFPIHFFDSLLPTRPTFAIELEKYSSLRLKSTRDEDRVYMPKQANQGFLLPIDPIDSLAGFLGAIVDSARNWQDNLQRILAGYRERTAHVALTDNEGGLNLNMDPSLIAELNHLGHVAGTRMLGFDLKEHQWRRFLVAYARLEDTFERMNTSYTGGFETFLNTYPPNTQSYKPTQQWFDEVHARLRQLIAVTASWKEHPLRTKGDIPRPDTDLRITPKP
jgi:hypothetical protein